MARYPAAAAERDRFILDRRPSRPRHDPRQAHGVVVEDERTASGVIARTATVFLTGRECPWHCAMCDLWQYTTSTDTPAGAIAAQVAAARARLEREAPPITQMKLYNAGSFFDPRAVPEEDYPGVAGALTDLSRVIVESHPALVGPRTRRLVETMAHAASGAAPTLEVAMGLETVHPGALERLNKRMTVEDVQRAAGRLADVGAALRVFLLVSPPFIPAPEQDEWLLRSLDVAWASGAAAVSLIPTRSGNGTLEVLAGDGLFRQPGLADLERSLTLALGASRGRPAGARVLADLWDLDRFADCPDCLEARRARLRGMNLEQREIPGRPCASCGFGEAA